MNDTPQFVLGADAGTHGIRILAMRLPDCHIAAKSAAQYHRVLANGLQELHAEALTEAFCKAMDELALPPHAEIKAIGITHQRGTLFPVDASGKALASAFCDSDERAADAAEYLKAGIDSAAYYRNSGCPIVSFNGFSKILWCRENLPKLFAEAKAWLSPQDYLLTMLSGQLQISEGSALRGGFLNVRTRKIWTELLPEWKDQNLDCTPVGESCGTVSAAWAERWPALRHTKLVAVPGDQPAAVLGCGTGTESVAINLGTTFVASMIAEQPVLDPSAMITTEVLPCNAYSPEFGTGAGGQFMDLLMTLMGAGGDPERWSRLEREADALPIGAEGLRIVPLLWQVTSAGIEGRISGLRPFQTQGHLMRAAYEGLAYETRLSVERLRRCVDQKIQTIRVFGGLSTSELFLKILASVMALPIEAAMEQQSSAVGAGLVCMLALHEYTDLDELRNAVGKPRCVVHPDREMTELYEREFQSYCEWR